MNIEHTERIPNLYPHYTHERFRRPQTVYIMEGKKLSTDGYVRNAQYEYNDRMQQWDYALYMDAVEITKQSGFDNYSAAFHERLLQIYFDDAGLRLVHILAGFNQATGYPYIVYGFIPGATQD